MEYDVFISYSTQNNNEATNYWIDKFASALESQTQLQFGRQVKIWRDTNNILPGADITESINEGIYESKVLIPVLSPSYVTSKWCADELETFMNHFQNSIKVGNNYRIIPVVFMPYENVEYDAEGSRNLERIKKIIKSDIRMELFFDPDKDPAVPVVADQLNSDEKLGKIAKMSGDLSKRIKKNVEDVARLNLEEASHENRFIYLKCPDNQTSFWKKGIENSLKMNELSKYSVTTETSQFAMATIDIFLIDPDAGTLEEFKELYEESKKKESPYTIVVSKKLALDESFQEFVETTRAIAC